MADTKPGLEFSSWMNIQPSEVGQAVKSGLLAYGMKQTGLTDWLNDLSKKSQPDGSVSPITSGAAGDKMTNGVWGNNPLPVTPPNFGSSVQAPAGAAMPQTIPTQPTMPSLSPSQIGQDWLNGKISSFTNPQAQRDISPQQEITASVTPMNPAEWQNSSTGESKIAQVMKLLQMTG